VNKIYLEISKLSPFFRKICYGITKDKEKINDAVQELYLYFLQMNPDTLRKIYENDGELGIKKYGAVVLKRSLTSPRSPFFYKYQKYYTNLVGVHMSNTDPDHFHRSIYNIAEEVDENIAFQKLDKIDLVLNNMYWYDAKIFHLYYYDGNTLDTLAKKTGISRNSLFTTIDKVRNILKEELLDE
tara:strand:- start:6 stop:557 length:552 start_codon:yes stop_codon:yes gene_type:complete